MFKLLSQWTPLFTMIRAATAGCNWAIEYLNPRAVFPRQAQRKAARSFGFRRRVGHGRELREELESMAKELKKRGKPKLAETIAIEKLWLDNPNASSQKVAELYNKSHASSPIDKAKAAQKKPKTLRRGGSKTANASSLDKIAEVETMYDSVGRLQDALGDKFDNILKEIESLMAICGSIGGIRKVADSRNRIRRGGGGNLVKK